jgi:Rrf2 family transcriptional regulator, iron-sulfur cluster assembly transcription factor
LARERRRITAGSVLRSVSGDNGTEKTGNCRIVREVVAPIVEAAGKVFLDELDTITLDDICRRMEDLKLCDEINLGPDFAI